MTADVRLTKPELWLLFRLARRDYVQATDRSERLRASAIHKLGTALELPPRILPVQPEVPNV